MSDQNLPFPVPIPLKVVKIWSNPKWKPFYPLGTFSLIEQCRSVFPLTVAPVSDRLALDNGKHRQHIFSIDQLNAQI